MAPGGTGLKTKDSTYRIDTAVFTVENITIIMITMLKTVSIILSY